MLKNFIRPTKNIHIIFTIAYVGVHIIKCEKITSTFKTWILRSTLYSSITIFLVFFLVSL